MADKENNTVERDIFSGEEYVEQKPVQEETPEEREIREINNSTIDHTRPNKFKIAIFASLAFIVVALGIFLYVYFWRPYVWENQQTGRIVDFKCQGFFFKTYEGNMISEERVTETSTAKDCDFAFSVDDENVKNQVMEIKGSGKRVTIVFREYHGSLPWRGDSKRIVTGLIVDGKPYVSERDSTISTPTEEKNDNNSLI